MLRGAKIFGFDTDKHANKQRTKMGSVARVDILPGAYFEPRAGGEVRIVGFYNNKQTKKKVRKQVRTNESLERMGLPLDLVNQKTKTKLVI